MGNCLREKRRVGTGKGTRGGYLSIRVKLGTEKRAIEKIT